MCGRKLSHKEEPTVVDRQPSPNDHSAESVRKNIGKQRDHDPQASPGSFEQIVRSTEAPPLVSSPPENAPWKDSNTGIPPVEEQAKREGYFDISSVSTEGNFWDDSRLPAGLISTILHTIFLIVLALLTLEKKHRGDKAFEASQGKPSGEIILETLQTNLDDLDQQRAVLDQVVNVEVSMAPENPQEIVPDQRGSSTPIRPLPDLGLSMRNPSASTRLPGKADMGKRTPEGRLEAGKRYGATEESEQAVEMALAYLAAHQRDNGSWSFDLNLAPCNGRCRHTKAPNRDSKTPVTGATGLALLAFLGAGYTHHQPSPYQETVRRGIYFLRSVAAETASGYDWQSGSMYGHGIALMALEEALCMTRDGNQYDSDLLDLVQQGANFSCIAQHPNGSWGYVPGRPGDVTITGWQVLSLIGSRKGGAALHTNTLPDAKSFLMSTCEGRNFWFGYNSPPGEPTTAAIGLTLMLFLGQSPYETPFERALDRIAEMGPLPNNIYHNYYASLALHHSRHRTWNRWNQRLRDHLVNTQVTEGHEKGSWHFPDHWGDVGGRLYTTALSAMTLEVYYRFLPLYDAEDLFPL